MKYMSGFFWNVHIYYLNYELHLLLFLTPNHPKECPFQHHTELEKGQFSIVLSF